MSSTATTRPDGTLSNAGWTFTGASLEASLQSISSPTAPSATPKISVAAGNGQDVTCSFSLADMPADYSVGISFELVIWRDVTGNGGGPTGSFDLIADLRRSNNTSFGATINDVGIAANRNGYLTSGPVSNAATLATANAFKVQLEAIGDITKCDVKTVYVNVVYTSTSGATKAITLPLVGSLVKPLTQSLV